MDSLQRKNVISLGDMNTYRMERPINDVLIPGGYKDLSTGLPVYSYVFKGASGTLPMH